MSEYMAYLATFGKSYNHADEFSVRFHHWTTTDKFITEWMANHAEGNKHNERPGSHSTVKAHTHTVAHNKFSDWEQKEKLALLVLKDHGMDNKH